MKDKRPILIIVCGGSGSGKSTIAHTLISQIPKHLTAQIICQDQFYQSNDHLPLSERKKQNYDHPDAFDWALMNSCLQQLLNNQLVDIPIYDYQTHLASGKFQTVGQSDIYIFEGIYTLFNQQINELAELKIYVDTPADERFIRRLQRDLKERKRSVDSVVDQWKKTVRPMYKNFVEHQKQKADLIVPWYHLNHRALRAIKNAILGFHK